MYEEDVYRFVKNYQQQAGDGKEMSAREEIDSPEQFNSYKSTK